jgi:hypothetical protein
MSESSLAHETVGHEPAGKPQSAVFNILQLVVYLLEFLTGLDARTVFVAPENLRDRMGSIEAMRVGPMAKLHYL